MLRSVPMQKGSEQKRYVLLHAHAVKLKQTRPGKHPGNTCAKYFRCLSKCQGKEERPREETILPSTFSQQMKVTYWTFYKLLTCLF